MSDYHGSKTNANNKGGEEIYYAVDRSNHHSAYKGFKLNRRETKLIWYGDYDSSFNLIVGKHKQIETTVFDVIKKVQYRR